MPTGTFTASAVIVGGRQRHHRTRDHFGTEEDDVVVLSAAIGKYAAGTTVATMLADLVARLESLEGSNHRVGSFTASAFIQPVIRANAVIQRTQSGSFTANAVITKGGTLSLNATIRRTQTGSLTANAVIV